MSPPIFRQALLAGAVAGVLSGIPSTTITLVQRRSPLAAVRAAGALVRRPSVVGGLAVHGVLSLFWAIGIAAVVGERLRLRDGAAAGLVIGVCDLGLIGRHVGAIRNLPQLPQYLDHIAFGIVVIAVLQRQRMGYHLR